MGQKTRVCVPLPRGINFSGPQGQADWEPNYTLTTTSLPAGAGLCVFLPSQLGDSRAAVPDVSHWVQLQRAIRIMHAIRAFFKKPPLVPCRVSYSSGPVLPPVCDGAGGRGGELTS